MKIFTDSRCQAHVSPAGYPERGERLEDLLAMLRSAGWNLQGECPHESAADVVARLHDPRYLERFKRAVERGDGILDSADNPLSAGTWSGAWGAAEAAVTAADWVRGASGRKAFAAVRPPGHHAERDTAMGFCYLNNAAIAAEHLRAGHGVARVAIFDFDVHHGNGTQHLFEGRADVFYGSVHQAPFYPGTGERQEIGRGEGEGSTVNIPLPAGTGDETFRAAVDEEILPAMERFQPGALVVSAGFDAWKGDPLGGFRLEIDTFHWLGRRLAAFADQACEGRMLSVLEGGYDLDHLPDLVAAYLTGQENRVE